MRYHNDMTNVKTITKFVVRAATQDDAFDLLVDGYPEHSITEHVFLWLPYTVDEFEDAVYELADSPSPEISQEDWQLASRAGKSFISKNGFYGVKLLVCDSIKDAERYAALRYWNEDSWLWLPISEALGVTDLDTPFEYDLIL